MLWLVLQIELLMKPYIFIAAWLSAATLAHAEIPGVDIVNLQSDGTTVRSLGWTRVEPGAFLAWGELRHAHEAGLISMTVTQETKAFDRHHKIWIDIPQGAELSSIGERCTGWMDEWVHHRWLRGT